MSNLDYECPQCCGYGCGWCHHTGRVTEDRRREIVEQDGKMNDDRDWGNERNRRNGAHFG